VEALYRAVLADRDGIVLATGGSLDGEGAFASGTVDLRSTEGLLRARISAHPSLLFRLAVLHLLAPGHLMARRSWERIIPRVHAGYILTIGVTTGSPVRGAEMLRVLERAFAARGGVECWVDTERSNTKGVGFYLRHGYAVASECFGQVLLRRRLTE
jgi:hypothetical protein